jgi:hypothetical protein
LKSHQLGQGVWHWQRRCCNHSYRKYQHLSYMYLSAMIETRCVLIVILFTGNILYEGFCSEICQCGHRLNRALKIGLLTCRWLGFAFIGNIPQDHRRAKSDRVKGIPADELRYSHLYFRIDTCSNHLDRYKSQHWHWQIQVNNCSNNQAPNTLYYMYI